MKEHDKKYQNEKFISMLDASKLCSYSQEYLSLLARRGKMFAKKIGRNWYTTKKALHDYLASQSVVVAVPKNILNEQKIFQPILATSLTPEEPEDVPLPTGHEGHSKIFEEFERLNPQLFGKKEPEQKIYSPATPTKPIEIKKPESSQTITPPPVSELKSEIEKSSNGQSEKVLSKLDKLSDSLERFAERVTEAIPRESQPRQILTQEQQEFFDEGLNSFSHRFGKFNKISKMLLRSPTRLVALIITAFVLLFIVAGGFSFGQVDYVVQQVKQAFKNADTLQGHFPGTHANEVLVLDKSGNISIFGHIETQGQLRSYAPTGVAPLVVDSVTKVDNLNADYLDNLDSKDFTLAFVTKNGNLTYEDVYLEGNAEVGKTLTVKGATKLMDSLQVYGSLGVLSDAVFGKDVTLTSGDLVLKRGTIKIFNTSLVKNLNAEYLDGVKKNDINLDFVTDNGSSTSNSITIGGLTVNGQSDFNSPGFFYKGVWGSSGSFGSLGVGGDAIFGDNKNPQDSLFQVYSKKFKIDDSGNVTASGTLTANSLNVLGNVISDLTPASSSFSLGTSNSPWENIYGVNASFTGNFVVSGSVNFPGTASRSFTIYTGNTSSDSYDSYLSFERGKITPNATILWDSTSKRFSINEPVRIASTSATAFEVSGGAASISNSLFVQENGNVGIGTTSPVGKFEITPGSSNNTTLVVDGGTTDLVPLYVRGSGSITKLSVANLNSTNTTNITKFGFEQLTTVQSRSLFEFQGKWADNTDATRTAQADLYVADNGVWGPRLTIQGSNVGIGTSSPSGRLDVVGDLSGSTGALFRVASTSDLFRVQENGLVGIGTTSPNSNLEINGSTGLRLNRDTSSYGSQIVFSEAETPTWYIKQDYDGSDSSKLQVVDSSGNYLLNLNQGGNVGIGTTNPGAQLEVAKAGDVIIKLNNTTANKLAYIAVNNSSNHLISGDVQGDLDILGNGPKINFSSNNGTSNALTILSGGNVGIGSTSPAGKLDIVGDVGTNTNALFRVASTSDLFRVQENGNVGIGTTSAGAKLFVQGLYNSGVTPYSTDGIVIDGDNAGLVIDGITSSRIYFGNSNSNVSGGIYYTKGAVLANDYLTLKTGGSTAVTILGSGNVGIGETNPTAKFEVSGGTASISNTLWVSPSGYTGNIGIGTSTPNDLLQIYGGAVDINNGNAVSANSMLTVGRPDAFSHTAIVRATNHSDSTQPIFFARGSTGSGNGVYLFLGENSSNTRVFSADYLGNGYFLGNVGIGTTGPGYKLEIAGGIGLWGVGTGVEGYLTSDVSHNLIINGGYNNNGGAIIQTITGGTAYPRMTITNGGNVGIGTTSPVNNLQIHESDATVNYLQFTNSTTGSTANHGTIYGIDSGGNGYFWNYENLGLYFGTNNQTRVLIKNDGNVGIGTTSPITKFEVEGTASASNLLTSGSLQVANGGASVSYSRFGLGTTAQGLTNPYDVLITGKLEVQNDSYFTHTVFNNASISQNFEVGGLIEASDGTAAAPSYTFSNDMDTGLFRIPDNRIGVAAGGSQVFAVGSTGASLSVPFELTNTASIGNTLYVQNNNGNVGIGTTTTGATLDVYGSNGIRAYSSGTGTGTLTLGKNSIGNGSSAILFVSSNVVTNWRIRQNDAVSGDLTLTPSTTAGGSTFTTPTMSLLGGNVGIGTTGPGTVFPVSTKLDVLSSNAVAAGLGVRGGSDGRIAYLGTQDFNNGGAAGSALYVASGAGTGNTYISLNEFTNGGGASGNLVLQNSGGNVGIGTTGPTARLHVVSPSSSNYLAIELSNNNSDTTSKGAIISGARYTNANTPFTALGAWDNNSSRAVSIGGGGWNAPDATRIQFYTAPSYTETNNQGVARMTIDSNGYVGIGTSSLETNFELVGTASISGNLLVGGFTQVNGTSSSSFEGPLTLHGTPAGTSINQGTLYIHPSSAGTNNVLLGIAVGSTEKFRADSEGDVQITGLFNSTSTSGTNQLSGALQVGGNTTLGTNSSNTITANGRFSSSLIPSADSTYNLGSPTLKWNSFYVASISVTNLTAGGTASNSFIINNGNNTADLEDSSLQFSRGTLSPNAIIKWDSANDQFVFNYPISTSGSVFGVGTASSSFAGPVWFTGSPTGTGLQQGTVYINPSTGPTDYTLFGIGVAGVTRFRVDAEGDTTIAGDLGLTNGLTISGTTGIVLSGVGAPITFSGTGNHDITASSGTLRLGTLTLIGNVSGNSQNITGVSQFQSQTASVSGNFEVGLIPDLFVDTVNDRVGIGQKPTSEKLEVAGNIKLTAAGNDTISNTSGDIIFTPNGNLFVSQGEVGLGTTTAVGSVRLNVSGGNLRISQDPGLSAANQLILNNSRGASDLANVIAFQGSGNNKWVLGNDISANGGQNFYLKDSVANATRIYVSPTGIIGLGNDVTSPAVALELASASAEFRVRSSGSTSNATISLWAGNADADKKFSILSNGTANADRLDILNGSNTLVTVASTGYVGIGTTGPGYLLDVNGAINSGHVGSSGAFTLLSATTGNTRFRVDQISDYGRLRLFNSVDTAIISFGGAQDSYINAGNVGIGTTVPANLLTVYSTSATSGLSILGSSTITSAQGVRIWNPNSSPDAAILAFGDGTGWKFHIAKNSDSGATKFVTFQDNGNVGIGSTSPSGKLDVVGDLSGSTGALFRVASTSDLFRVQENGNVGIGTTSAIAKLQIGDNLATGYLDNFSEYQLLLYQGANALTSYGLGIAPGMFTLNSNGGYSFDKAGSSTFVRIDSAGNVGIGTTSPIAALDIEPASTYTGPLFRVASGSNEALRVTSAGYVGIGTTSPQGVLFTHLTTDKNIRFSLETEAAIGGVNDLANAFVPLKIDASALYLNSQSAGNVGIGTTNPANAILQIGAVDFGALFSKQVSVGVSSNTSGYIVGESFLNYASFGWDNATGAGSISTKRGGVGGGVALSVFDTAAGLPFVGVGTTAPTARLDVVGDVGTNTNALFRVASTSDLFRVQENGNVGIGTTGPSEKLDVRGQYIRIDNTAVAGAGIKIAGATNFDNYYSVYNGSTEFYRETYGVSVNSVTLAPQVSGTNFILQAPTSGYLTLGANGGEKLRIDTTGNVGIGTTSPIAKLDIEPASTYTGPLFRVASGSNEALRVTSSGNVGIGTTIPNSKLHIAGDISLDSGKYIKGQRTLDNAYVNILGTSGDDTIIGLMRSTVSKLYFRNTASQDIMTLTSEGNVGIGSTSPSGKLDVVGDLSGSTGALFRVASTSSLFQVLENGNVGIGTTSPLTAIPFNASPITGLEIKSSAGTGLALSGTQPQFYFYDTDNAANRKSISQAFNSDKFTISALNDAGSTTFVFFNGNALTGNVGIGTSSPVAALDLVPATSFTGPLFRVASGSNEALRVTSAGYVGIGTTVPASLLHIGSGTGSSNYSVSIDNTAKNGIYLNGSGSYGIYQNDTGKNYFAGNVGIGSTSPSGKLDVVGDLAGNTGALFRVASTSDLFRVQENGNVGIGTTSAGAALDLQSTYSAISNNVFARFARTGGAIATVIGYNAVTTDYMYIGTNTNHPFALRTNDTTALYVDTNQNVGIGTTGPGTVFPVSTKLDVLSSNAVAAGLGVRGGSDGRIAYLGTQDFNNGGAAGSALYVASGAGTGNTYISLNEFTNGGGASGNLVLQNSGGNVGIGTTGPNAKLDIAAASNANALQITNSSLAGSKGWVWYPITNGTATDLRLWEYGDTNGFRFGIQAGGNVGIGSTAPSGKLDVVGDLSGSTGALFRVASTSDLFRVQENGNVGIGTTSAGYNLTLTYGGASTQTMLGLQNYSSTAGYDNQLRFEKSNSDTKGTLTATTDGTYLSEFLFRGVDSNNSAFRSAATIEVRQDGSASTTYVPGQIAFKTTNSAGTIDYRLMIRASGNVGIGTTNPTAAFDVTPLSTYTGPLFRVASGSNEALRVTSSGNVGIGTTVPAALLTATGDKNAFRAGVGVGDINTLTIGSSGGGYAGIGYNLTFRNNPNQWTYNGADKASLIDFYSGGFKFWGTSTIGSAAASASLSAFMTITNTGNVGIGTTSPIAALDIEPSSTYTGPLFRVASGSNEALRIASDGNVGIGTTGPTSKLHIYDTNRLYSDYPNLAVMTSDAQAIDKGGRIGLGGLADVPVEFGSIVGRKENSTAGNRAGYLGFATYQSGVGPTEWMRITSVGNVGIGTSAPNTDLDLRKTSVGGTISARIRNDDNTNSASDARLIISDGGESAGDPYITFDVGNPNWSVGVDNSDSNKFKIGSALTVKPGTGDMLTIDTNGNVGIGTTTTGQQFVVGGGANGDVDICSKAGCLTGYTGTAYPTIKSTGSYLYYDVNSTYVGYWYNNGLVTLKDLGVGGGTGTDPTMFGAYAGSADLAGLFYRATSTAGAEITRYDSDVGGAKTAACSILANGTTTCTSDARLKTNINYISSALDVVNQLKPATYNWKNDPNSRISSGFIAQDVQKVLPYLVYSLPGDNGLLTLDREGIIPFAIAGVQELDARTASSSFSLYASQFQPGDVVTMDANSEPKLASASYMVTGVIDSVTASGSVKTLFGGRTPVKVSLENGPIQPGDRLTLSSTPGVAMKATGAGMVIGMALDPASSVGSSSYTTIDAYVNVSYWAPSAAAITNSQLPISNTASGSSNITVTSTGSPTDILSALASAVMTKVQSLWVTGDIIVEGIKKTYFDLATTLQSQMPNGFDLATLVGNWTSRQVTISPTADINTVSSFSGNGAQAAEQSKLDLADNGNYIATYSIDSARNEIQLSGHSKLVGGEAKIFFDFSFTSVISDQVPLRVLTTPTTDTIRGQLYVATKNQYGFIVKELNGMSDGEFDWLVIARRKGFEGNDTFGSTASSSISNSQLPISNTSTSSTTTTSSSSPAPTASSSTTTTSSGSPAPTASSSTTTTTSSTSPAPTASSSMTNSQLPISNTASSSSMPLTTSSVPTTASSSSTLTSGTTTTTASSSSTTLTSSPITTTASSSSTTTQ